MADSIEVIAIGSPVLLGELIAARVTAVFIREGRVSYECVWWDDGKRQEEVVDPWELRPDGDEQRRLRVDPVL